MTPVSHARYIGPALVALHGLAGLDRPFKRAELEAGAGFAKRTTTNVAIVHLTTLGFLRRADELQQPGRPAYVVTDEGRAAARAAAEAAAENTRAQADPFARRVWALLRARGQLTAPQAAELLANAEDGDADRVRDRVARLLRAWCCVHPHAIQTSAKRVAGAKRYVLLVDLGPQVPAVKRIATEVRA